MSLLLIASYLLQVGYIALDGQTKIQTCPGVPDVADLGKTLYMYKFISFFTLQPQSAIGLALVC